MDGVRVFVDLDRVSSTVSTRAVLHCVERVFVENLVRNASTFIPSKFIKCGKDAFCAGSFAFFDIPTTDSFHQIST